MSCCSARMGGSQDVFRNTPHWCTMGTHTHTHTSASCCTVADKEYPPHTGVACRQDQGQLPASIFIISMFPDLLLPSWRQWSKPSLCNASTLQTHLKTHMLPYTLQPDNWDQLLQGAPPQLTLLPLHLPFWQRTISKTLLLLLIPQTPSELIDKHMSIFLSSFIFIFLLLDLKHIIKAETIML